MRMKSRRLGRLPLLLLVAVGCCYYLFLWKPEVAAVSGVVEIVVDERKKRGERGGTLMR